LIEFEKHNKTLLEKVKELNEEKARIQIEERARREEIESKCEDFKNDVIAKFKSTDTEVIRADNESLRQKLEEYKENTKQITENLQMQLELKDMQNANFEEEFRTQITSKFDELKEQTEKFGLENSELRKEYNTVHSKFEQLTSALGKFHQKFEVGKKEFEKRAQEIFNLTKENRQLKVKDIEEINKENAKVKLELDSIISENKALQEKIAKFKENLNTNNNSNNI
jgi:hypothetical protein